MSATSYRTAVVMEEVPERCSAVGGWSNRRYPSLERILPYLKPAGVAAWLSASACARRRIVVWSGRRMERWESALIEASGSSWRLRRRGEMQNVDSRPRWYSPRAPSEQACTAGRVVDRDDETGRGCWPMLASSNKTDDGRLCSRARSREMILNERYEMR